MNGGDGIVIVGGGPAGLATARAYREKGGCAPVTLLASERRSPYRRPPLTKDFLLGGTVERELLLETDRWYAEHDVCLRTGVAATRLDVTDQSVTLDNGDELPYEACVLATGSEAARLSVPGADEPGVLTMRTIEDALALRRHGSRVAVIGSGFVGCEASATLARRGAHVTMITDEPVPQADRLGAEVGGLIAGWLEEAGVELVAGAAVEAITPAWRVRAGEAVVEADTVLMASGARPRLELAEAAGLAIAGGGVATGADMRASDRHVLAVGDVAYAHNEAAGRALRVEHWGEALAQGAVAGAELAGEPARWGTAPGFWSVIGRHTLKHVAWGDGYQASRLDVGSDGAFTAWYSDAGGACVGVLTHDRDQDYVCGRWLVESGAQAP